MHYLQQSPGRTAIINHKEYLFFSGYSYLGMGHVQEYIELANRGIKEVGLLHPSSRSSNTRLQVYEQMEQLLSQITMQRETVLFSSGYLAGRAVSTLYRQHEHVFVAPGTHPAILQQGIQLYNDWQQQFIQQTQHLTTAVLLVDSVYPLSSSVNDFSFLQQVSPATKVICIVDDSHGIGILGTQGEGVVSLLPSLPNVEYVLTYSLSKAYHINGGAVSASKDIAAALRNSPFYTGSTSVAPFLAYTFISAKEIYKQQLQKLRQNIEAFRTLMKDVEKVVSDERLPIFVLPKNLDQHYFEAFNILVSSFPYPDPSGEIVNRIVLNALHTTDDLLMLADAIKRASA